MISHAQAFRRPPTGTAEDASTTASSPTRNTPEFRANARPQACKKLSTTAKGAKPIETKDTSLTLAFQANAGPSSLEFDSTTDASQKGHASHPTSSRLRLYAQERQHRTARKKQLPTPTTPTPSKTPQGHDEAARRVPTLVHGLQPPLRPNHRREHVPRHYHNDDLRKTQTDMEATAMSLSMIRNDQRDRDSESKESMPAHRPTKAPANGPPLTSDGRCHAYTQAMKQLFDVLCVDCTYASGTTARSRCNTFSSTQGHPNKPLT